MREPPARRARLRSSSAPGTDEAFAALEQLRRVQSVTDAALANLGVEALLDELLVRVREVLSADTASILLVDESGSELVARAAKGLEEEVRQRVRIPIGRGFAGTVAATGKPLAIPDVEKSIVINPILRETGVHSVLGVPLLVKGQALGVLHVGTLQPREFTKEDTELLQLVGDRVALAIHAGLYERQQTISRMLQRIFLPERPPPTVGLELATRYVAPSLGQVGGDWYDVFVLPDGMTAIAIGDVMGRGLSAAATMAKLRSALRAYALESPPGDVLRRLDTFMTHLIPDEIATLLYGVYDPSESIFVFSNAGHMPPLIRDRDGSVRVLEMRPQTPLGVTVAESFEQVPVTLEIGTTLILYTDGLIERRDEPLNVGIERLRKTVAADLLPEAMCDRIIDRLGGGRKHSDDIALLVARKTRPAPASAI
jgi:phosphoserine phosphatase RsbU/P